MREFISIKDCLHYRITEPEDNYYYVTLWEKEVNIVCSDLDAGMQFINNECTDEELYWLSEVFEDIAAKSHSAEFIQCIRERAARVEDSKRRADIQQEIEEWAVPALETPEKDTQ